MKNINRKKTLAATLATVTVLMASLPIPVSAATQTVDPAEKDSFEVVASASVTDEELAELGLNVIISIPAEIALSLDENKAFSGSDKIYAYGIMDSDSKLSVTIDAANEAYGKVKYRKSASGVGTESAVNFFSTVAESLSRESFSAEETKDNYLAQKDGNSMTTFSTLDVSIKNLIPTSGTGIYYTTVPLQISMQ